MSNAAKFSNENSVVEVSATVIKDKIRIAVTDKGLGIPLEFKSRVFEKFTQADTSDRRAISGTGLGLHISKAIVEQHQGELSFISELDEGSTFYIDLQKANPETEKSSE